MTRRFGWVLAFTLLLAPVEATSSDVGGRDDETALAAAARDLCSRDLVLIGENDYHGDGSGIAFKAALIRRLVEKCRFNAVFFEASHYDFLAFSRRLRTGRPVSADMVASALGWIWNHDAEVAPLIPFLFAEAKARRLTLGGLDDQLGARDAFYSLDEMPRELTALVPAARGAECRERLRQKIWNDYPAAAPHDEASRARLQLCLTEIAAAARGERDRAQREFHLQLVANAERHAAREFQTPERYSVGRDRSMYLNLRWLAARLPPRSKIIIWAENAHIDKDASGEPSFGGGRNLGSWVHQAYGRRAFALAFSSASGAYRYSRHDIRRIPEAAPDSVEARALAGTDRDTVYVGPGRLAAMGAVPGGIFQHRAATANWARFVDGLVVFRKEHPVTRVDE
jgi:erythromycin esterase-like protein